jgi:branched-chain amino acid aminotransferase
MPAHAEGETQVQSEKIWFDGELIDYEDVQVHVLSHALHYGSGVFEGIRAYATDKGPGVFHLSDHVARLRRSAEQYYMEIPFTDEQIKAGIHETIRANGLEACYIRPLVFRGRAEMGVNPLNCPVHVMIAVWKWGAYLGDDAIENGIRCMISSWRRIGPNTMPATAKASGQYLNSQLAKIEALKHGFDEAILLNEQGMIADGSGENVFAVHKGRLLTPPISASCLPGITREAVMEMAETIGVSTVERDLTRAELYFADEVFLTGTAAEVTPVASLDDHPIGKGPITTQIQSIFFDVVHGRHELSAQYLEYPA